MYIHYIKENMHVDIRLVYMHILGVYIYIHVYTYIHIIYIYVYIIIYIQVYINPYKDRYRQSW